MDFPTGKYSIIYADPPWAYEYKGKESDSKFNGVNRGHYDRMSVGAISALPVKDIAADDALLFLWMTSPLIPEAIEVGKAWGFKWTTVAFVWDKQHHNVGHYTLSQCELCAVFKRGRIPQPRGIRNARQFISEHRGKHSAKPAEVRDRITAMFPTQRKIELFARQRTEGWDAWGNEING